MADLNPRNSPDDEQPIPGLNEGYAEEAPEVEDEQPRRAASARFIVDSQVGTEAAMRNAMDPANQSLAEALRLSYRVLQSVILVLIVLFLVSGFQTVDEGQSGVRTVWGKIVSVDGAEALTPGPKFSIFPYPIAEFVLFQDSNRTVDVSTPFAPAKILPTHEQMLERADVATPLTPGPRGDGSLLTRDGDLAHIEFSARYAIDQPGPFVRRVNDADASRNSAKLVDLALRRAAIHITAGASLQDIIDQTDDIRVRIQQNAQSVLDELGCGITITQVQVQRAYAPLAIEKALGNLQEARVAAAESVERARQKANEALNKIAGNDAEELLALIEQYEDVRERGEEAGADELLKAINARLEQSQSGEVAQIVQEAKAYQSRIESSLGNEYRRFASLLPAYRQNPQLLMRQHWLDVYAKVISRPDAETIYVDPLMSMRLTIAGSATVQEIRRKAMLARKEEQSKLTGWDKSYFYLRARDLTYGRPGRMLGVQDGKAVPYGATRP